jgi:hypothetical protein
MTWEKFACWVIFWLIVTGVVVMLICGCGSKCKSNNHDVHWITGSAKYMDTNNGEYQLGFRDDNMVVWRKIK